MRRRLLLAYATTLVVPVISVGCRSGSGEDAGVAGRIPDVAVTTPVGGVNTSAPSAQVETSPVPSIPSFTPPAQLTSGPLAGLMGHRGSGEASIWRQPDGSLVVRLEGFDVSNVGALTVYLVPGRGKDRPEGGVRLGQLRDNRGSVNLPVPAGIDVSYELTVLIWSEASLLPVASATLTPA